MKPTLIAGLSLSAIAVMSGIIFVVSQWFTFTMYSQMNQYTFCLSAGRGEIHADLTPYPSAQAGYYVNRITRPVWSLGRFEWRVNSEFFFVTLPIPMVALVLFVSAWTTMKVTAWRQKSQQLT